MTSDALILRLARDARDLRAAQRLRYEVFIEELGAGGPLVDHDQRLEIDAFDPFFDHLLLIDPKRDPDTLSEVVGVYRLLPPDGCGCWGAGCFWGLLPMAGWRCCWRCA